MEEIINNLEKACNELVLKVEQLISANQKANTTDFTSNEELVKLQAQISKLSANNREAVSKINSLILKVKNLKKI